MRIRPAPKSRLDVYRGEASAPLARAVPHLRPKVPMTPADVIWLFLLLGLQIRLWPRAAPPPVRKGSPLYTPPAEVRGGDLVRAMKRGSGR